VVLTQVSYPQEYTVMTENLEPLAYIENNKIKGLGVEIVQKMLKKLKIPEKITFYPWARAYQYLITQPKHVLFSTVRNSQREKLFKWVGPIIKTRSVFFKRADSDIEFESLDAARGVDTILVSRNFPEYQILKQMNFKNLYVTSNPAISFKMLIGKRADLLANMELTSYSILKKNNIDPKLIKKTNIVIFKRSLYIAMSIDTPDDVVKKWQDVFDGIKKTGFYKRVMKKYIP
jgi:polar amino acid transport system substrate-binding protein